MARPNTYTPEVADTILNRITNGEMLTKICEADDQPDRLTFYRWMKAHPQLANDYARARLGWADFWAERVISVSQNPEGSIDADGKVFVDHAAVAWAKLFTDNVKWLVGKYAPRTYGDRPEPIAEQSPPLQIIRTIIVDPRDDPNHLGNAKPPEPPRQLPYLPSVADEFDAKFLQGLVDLIRRHVPRADERPPNEVLAEVLRICGSALSMHYG
jgi:hypothetical protein